MLNVYVVITECASRRESLDDQFETQAQPDSGPIRAHRIHTSTHKYRKSGEQHLLRQNTKLCLFTTFQNILYVGLVSIRFDAVDRNSKLMILQALGLFDISAKMCVEYLRSEASRRRMETYGCIWMRDGCV